MMVLASIRSSDKCCANASSSPPPTYVVTTQAHHAGKPLSHTAVRRRAVISPTYIPGTLANLGEVRLVSGATALKLSAFEHHASRSHTRPDYGVPERLHP